MEFKALTAAFLLSVATAPVFAQEGQSQGPIELDPTGLFDDQFVEAQKFVEDLNRTIPAKLATSFGHPVKIRFSEIGKASGPGLEISCNGSSKVELGFVSKQQGDVITLNKGLIQDVVAGPEKSRKLDCMHGSYYREAKATAIHELGHLYDFKTGSSSRSEFRVLNGWDADGKQKNTIYSQSMDPYEFYDPAEAFAVNLEYYLLDPEYACRRPSNSSFMNRLIGTPPGSAPIDCSKHRSLYVGTDRKPVSIDPKRVYQIQYLQAEPGSEMMSKWGHAMIRLVVCDPKRVKPGPDCLLDIDHHVVLSYRAGMNDLKVNYLKGLNGGYPSQLFAFKMDQILEEYGRGELRDIKGYPLKLNETQKDNLLNYLLEQYWGYEGKYYFLSNNCATETRKAFQAGFGNEAKAEVLKDPPVISPIDLQKALEQAELVDRSVFQDPKKAIENGYHFPSQHKTQLENAFRSVRRFIPEKFPTLEKYLTESTARDRAEVLSASASELKANPRLAASFLTLEFQVDRINKKRVLEALAKLGEKSDRPEVREILHSQQSLSQRNFVAKGAYGVPSEADLNPCASMQATAELQAVGDKLSELVSVALPELKADVELTDENLLHLMDYLKLLNRN